MCAGAIVSNTCQNVLREFDERKKLNCYRAKKLRLLYVIFRLFYFVFFFFFVRSKCVMQVYEYAIVWPFSFASMPSMDGPKKIKARILRVNKTCYKSTIHKIMCIFAFILIVFVCLVLFVCLSVPIWMVSVVTPIQIGIYKRHIHKCNRMPFDIIET